MAEPLRYAAALAVVIASAGAVLAAGTGPAAATTVQRTLQFMCSSPLYGTTPMTGVFQANAPDSAVVGQAVPGILLNATATVGPSVSLALNLISATSVEGTAEATVAAQGSTSVIPLTISDARVPASGPMTFDSFGMTPPVVFTHPGPAEISLLGLTVRLTPVRSDGTAPVGTAEGTCTLDAGQSSVLDTITVISGGTGAPPPPPAPPPSEPPPATTPGSGSTAPAASTTPAARSTSSAPTASGSGSTAPAANTPSSSGPTAPVSGTADPSPTASSSRVPLPAVLGALVVCAGALGTFLWLRRRPGRGGENGG